MKKLFRKEEGFTIIEVVLVLAIAGLIFLIVFLALPQLQKSRRDTQRKSDAGRIAASLESYAGNSSGKYPETDTELGQFIDTYIVTENFNDPSTGNVYTYDGTSVSGGTTTYDVKTGGNNTLSASGSTDTDLPPGDWLYYTESQCGDNGLTEYAAGEFRSISVRMGLEVGTYCVDNQ